MGGSGGGSSGKTDFPDYMKTRHDEWLQDIDNLLTTAIAANPYTSAVSYNPDTVLGLIISTAAAFKTYIDDLVTGIAAAVSAFDIALTNQFAATSVARYEAGMRSIGAVQTSSFVIGKAMMLARKDEQVARYSAELNLNAFNRFPEYYKMAYAMIMEGYKLQIIAKKEQANDDLEYDVKTVTWSLDLYHYGQNMLSALGSGGSSNNPTRPSKTQTAIGGALSGAATGAMIGSAGPQASVGGTVWGAVIGAVVGGVGGYMMGS
jgi:hypothetical protein